MLRTGILTLTAFDALICSAFFVGAAFEVFLVVFVACKLFVESCEVFGNWYISRTAGNTVSA